MITQTGQVRNKRFSKTQNNRRKDSPENNLSCEKQVMRKQREWCEIVIETMLTDLRLRMKTLELTSMII